MVKQSLAILFALILLLLLAGCNKKVMDIVKDTDREPESSGFPTNKEEAYTKLDIEENENKSNASIEDKMIRFSPLVESSLILKAVEYRDNPVIQELLEMQDFKELNSEIEYKDMEFEDKAKATREWFEPIANGLHFLADMGKREELDRFYDSKSAFRFYIDSKQITNKDIAFIDELKTKPDAKERYTVLALIISKLTGRKDISKELIDKYTGFSLIVNANELSEEITASISLNLNTDDTNIVSKEFLIPVYLENEDGFSTNVCDLTVKGTQENVRVTQAFTMYQPGHVLKDTSEMKVYVKDFISKYSVYNCMFVKEQAESGAIDKVNDKLSISLKNEKFNAMLEGSHFKINVAFDVYFNDLPGYKMKVNMSNVLREGDTYFEELTKKYESELKSGTIDIKTSALKNEIYSKFKEVATNMSLVQ